MLWHILLEAGDPNTVPGGPRLVKVVGPDFGMVSRGPDPRGLVSCQCSEYLREPSSQRKQACSALSRVRRSQACENLKLPFSPYRRMAIPLLASSIVVRGSIQDGSLLMSVQHVRSIRTLSHWRSSPARQNIYSDKSNHTQPTCGLPRYPFRPPYPFRNLLRYTVRME